MSSMRTTAVLTVTVLAVVAGTACRRKATTDSRPRQSASATPRPDAPTVVAVLEGGAISLGEVDLRAADRLTALRQQEYEARRDAVNEIVAEKLIEKEAVLRGVTVAELLKTEVDAKVAPAKPEDVSALYEQNKDRFAGRSRQQGLAEVGRALQARNRQVREAAFRDELRARANVKISLEPPRQDLAVPPGTPVLGSSKAPVTILEFADFQCPYCKRAEETMIALLDEYKGKVRFVHRDFPLDGHERAFVAARASRCAGEQGQFWEYRKSLLLTPGDFGDEDLKKRASGLGLDRSTFATCIASDRHDAAIRLSAEEGAKAGVSATPTFFLNGRMQAGAGPIEGFRRIIDEELARKGT